MESWFSQSREFPGLLRLVCWPARRRKQKLHHRWRCFCQVFQKFLQVMVQKFMKVMILGMVKLLRLVELEVCLGPQTKQVLIP